MRRAGRAPRVLRGAVAAAVATFVALLSHVTAGGAIPGWIGIAVPLALSFVVCTALAGRRLSAGRVAAAVAMSQVLFHTLFVLGGFDAGAGGHVHGAAAPVLATGAAGSGVATDAAMWMGHAFAAAATTLVLHRGERAVGRLAELAGRLGAWLRARVRIVATAHGPAPVRRVFADTVAEVRPLSVLLSSTALRRGPPLRTA